MRTKPISTENGSSIFPASEYLTVAQIRDYLAISQSAAYGLTHSEGFPVTRIGTSIRIPKEAFFAWVAANTVIPAGVADYLNAVS